MTDIMRCDMCGLDYTEPSMGGDGVCPWCDMGITRDGRKWTYRETIAHGDARVRRLRERGGTP